MKLVRHYRPEEALADTIKPVMRGNRDSQRATGTEKAQTAATVAEMVPVVADALEKAQQAIDDAANALTTSSGKNSRRRGESEPSPPPGGWVQGDQWIVDNADGVPVEVRVWDGAAFQPEQLLAAELLVLSGGLIRLADGVVTADAIAADAIDGMTITGALIRTAAAGQRLELDANGLRAFNASSAVVGSLKSDTGGLLLAGALTSYPGGGSQRAVLSNGALTFDVPTAPGAGSMTLGPSGMSSTDSNARLQVVKTSASPGVGVDVVAGSGANQAGIALDGASGGKIRFYASTVEMPGDAVGAFTPASGWTILATHDHKLRRRRDVCYLQVTLQVGTGAALENLGTVPPEFRPADKSVQAGVAVGQGGRIGTIMVNSAGKVEMVYFTSAGTGTYLPISVQWMV